MCDLAGQRDVMMADMFTVKQRSVIMGRIRSRGNDATEMQFIRLLRRSRIRGWRRGSLLPGKPDFVFAAARVAVFIDGDFWHGNPRKFRLPKSNVAYWTAKILGNRRRDRAVNRLLRSAGWRVVRFWQSSLTDEPRVLRRLSAAVEAGRMDPRRPSPVRSRQAAKSGVRNGRRNPQRSKK